MLIRIKNLRLRTIIGVYDWEREHEQDVVINITLRFDGSKAVKSDDLNDTVDYKTMNKHIIAEVQKSSYELIEALAGRVLDLVMEDEKVLEATVEVDKPGVLRFTDSVSVVETRVRDQ
ncbi:MAG: dihydroneopterin aldolase [Phycisphaerae bacterium]